MRAGKHERLPEPAYAGIGLITLGVLLLGFLSHRAAASTPRIASAIGWSLLTSATIAAYTLTDRQGVRLASPASYIGVLFLVLTGFLTAFVAWPNARAADAGSRFQFSRATSTSTGTAPTAWTQRKLPP